jgi:hypothetical protein
LNSSEKINKKQSLLSKYLWVWAISGIILSCLIIFAVVEQQTASKKQLIDTITQTTANVKKTYISTMMVCPDGYATKYLQTPTRENDTFVSRCSNEGVFITDIMTASDHWDNITMVGKDTVTMAYTDHYGSQVLRGIGNGFYEILKPAKPQIADGDIVVVHKFIHYQPGMSKPYGMVLSNGTTIYDIKLINEIISNQTKFGLTENIIGFVEAPTDNQNTYGEYQITDLNYTDPKLGKAPFMQDRSDDG